MPGIYELAIALIPIAVGAAIVVAAVLRLRKKLAAEAKPTLGTYLNEIGGYAVAGVIALAIGVYLLVSGNSASQGPSEQQPPAVDASTNRPDRSVEDEILARLVGVWKIRDAESADGRAVAVAYADKVRSEPWVLWRVYDPGSRLVGIQLTGFDRGDGQFHRYALDVGSPNMQYRGAWDTEPDAFSWKSNVPGDVQHTVVETVSEDRIANVMTWRRDGEVLRESTTLLTRTDASDLSFQPSPMLDHYLGEWTFNSTVRSAGPMPFENKGKYTAVQIEDKPIVVERFRNPGGGLADVRLMYVTEAEGLRRVFVNSQGRLVDMHGSWDAASETLTWKVTSPGEGEIGITDTFMGNDRILATMEFSDEAGRTIAAGTTEFDKSQRPVADGANDAAPTKFNMSLRELSEPVPASDTSDESSNDE